MALKGKERIVLGGLFIIGCLWFVALGYSASVTRNAFVFGDEAGYFLPIIFGSSPNNYQHWGDTFNEYPSYLYFWLYSELPREELHFWVKILNAAFVASTAWPTYIVARRYLAEIPSAVFACFVIATPIASFARYVMPETLYFFGFWCSLAVVLLLVDRHKFLAGCCGGLATGALSLVKPHAIAVAFGLGAYLLIRDSRRPGVLAALVLTIAYYVARLALGQLIVGHPIWNASGGAYTGMLQTRIDWPAAILNSLGHLFALGALLGPIVVVPIVALFRDRKCPTETDLATLTLCLIGSMLLMTIYFSQSIYQFSLGAERITRLHGRYYVYPIPLFVLLSGLCLKHLRSFGAMHGRILRLSMFTFAICGTIIFLFYKTGPIDYADLTLLSGSVPVATGLIVMQLAVALYCLYRAPQYALVAALSLIVFIQLGTTCVLTAVAPTIAFAPGTIDFAFLRSEKDSKLRSLIGRPDGVVIGSPDTASDVSRAMFYLESLSHGQYAPPSNTVGDDNIPANVTWLLLLPGVHYVGTKKVTAELGLLILENSQK